MACLDADTFGLPDHGQSITAALTGLMTIPKIQNGALGVIIGLIRTEIIPLITATKWLPYQPGQVNGNGLAIYQPSVNSADKLEITGYQVTVTETIRAQVVHELVHCLDFHYYHYSLTHPPSESGIKRRAPVLWLTPNGQLWKEDFFLFPLQQTNLMAAHENELKAMQALTRDNSLLSKTQRALMMRQLDYASRADKMHVEFTPNVAQCLAYLYQWGFTGEEKGFLKNPRSVAMLITRMERALTASINSWRTHTHYTRRVGDVMTLQAGDERLSQTYTGDDYKKDNWYRPPVPPKPVGLGPPARKVPPPVPPRPGRG